MRELIGALFPVILNNNFILLGKSCIHLNYKKNTRKFKYCVTKLMHNDQNPNDNITELVLCESDLCHIGMVIFILLSV